MTTLSLAILLAIPAALTAPVSEVHLDRPTPGQLTLCTGTHLTGDCTTLFLDINVGGQVNCQMLPSDLVKNVKSVDAEPGAICRLFDERNGECRGTGVAFLAKTFDRQEDLEFGQLGVYISCNPCTKCYEGMEED